MPPTRTIAARAALALALAAYERGDHAAAIAHLEHAFELERPSPLERVEVFVTLGRAYDALGQTEREIALYEECLEEIGSSPATTPPSRRATASCSATR